MNKIATLLIGAIVLTSCFNKYDKEAVKIVKEWTGKKISNIPLTDYVAYSQEFDSIGKVSVHLNTYKILVYINEEESESCRLHLYEWNSFFREIDSLSNNVSNLIIVKPKNKFAFIQSLRDYHFTRPVYIDEDGKFNAANKLPTNILYHQFLLGKNNDVLFIGNPLNSQKIRKAYIDIIKGKQLESPNTGSNASKAKLSTNNVDLGEMPLYTTKNANIVISNISEYPLIIQEARTRCGCIQIDYNKKPVTKGGTSIINISYHATNLGMVNKDIMVYCNTKESPYIIKIKGIVILNKLKPNNKDNKTLKPRN